jgi:hypothetical protein
MKYRKKPVEIEAIQLTRDNWEEIVAFTEGEAYSFHNGTCVIPTLEGNMFASEGDYIIKGVQGEFYPCKPDIFAQTYERVENE